MTAPSIENALTAGLHAVDSGRRVAWAKFYELRDKYQQIRNYARFIEGVLDATSLCQDGLSPEALKEIREVTDCASYLYRSGGLIGDPHDMGMDVCLLSSKKYPVKGRDE